MSFGEKSQGVEQYKIRYASLKKGGGIRTDIHICLYLQSEILEG